VAKVTDEQPEPLSIGVIVDPSVENRAWRDAARKLTIRIAEARAGMMVPLNVNVVFHIGGRSIRPEFSGVRTGSFNKRHSLLMVQVALPAEVPPDPDSHVKRAVRDALDLAERWAERRRIPCDIPALRSILDKV
jgi:hypothetical protein